MPDIDFEELPLADLKKAETNFGFHDPEIHLQSPAQKLEEYLDVYCGLSRFYNRPDLQKRRLDLKKAVRSEWDRAVHQILKMFGGTSHLKAQGNVVIGIGSSPVKGHAGPFVAYLVNQLKARGYNNIFYVKNSTLLKSVATVAVKQKTRMIHAIASSTVPLANSTSIEILWLDTTLQMLWRDTYEKERDQIISPLISGSLHGRCMRECLHAGTSRTKFCIRKSSCQKWRNTRQSLLWLTLITRLSSCQKC